MLTTPKINRVRVKLPRPDTLQNQIAEDIAHLEQKQLETLLSNIPIVEFTDYENSEIAILCSCGYICDMHNRRTEDIGTGEVKNYLVFYCDSCEKAWSMEMRVNDKIRSTKR